MGVSGFLRPQTGALAALTRRYCESSESDTSQI
jgi:hypothetical protein